jgi:hypothetical protein
LQSDDYLDAEIDATDNIEARPGELSGVTLLKTRYSILTRVGVPPGERYTKADHETNHRHMKPIETDAPPGSVPMDGLTF